MRSGHIRDAIRELNWYADLHEQVLGVVALDLTDGDFSYVVLGRGEVGRFRAIDLKVSLSHEGTARSALKRKMAECSKTGQTVFPQGDTKGEAFDVLTPIDLSAKARSSKEPYRNDLLTATLAPLPSSTVSS
jgi:hypothetical protein